MSNWFSEFDSVFWITLATLLTGSIGLSVKYCLNSKCENVSVCWGGIIIHRNVELEQNEEIEMTENTNNI